MHTTTFNEPKLPLYAQRKVADLVVKAVLEYIEPSQKRPSQRRPVPPAIRVVKALMPGNSVLPPQLLRGIFALSTKTACST